jgi:hypothetical protein
MRFNKSILLWAFAPLLSAQTWTYTLVADSNTVRPDGLGNFNVASTQPAIEGPWVVFVNDSDSIWSYNLSSRKFVKIVDTSMAVPGGSGNFNGFPVCDGDGETVIQLHQGTVLFYGSDGKGPGFCSGGYYTVPVAGGTISKVLDYNTILPDGGVFSTPQNAPSLYQGKVVVSAQTQTPFDGGIWSVDTNGADLARIADYNTPYCINPPGCTSTAYEYVYGFIGGSNAAFTTYGELGWQGLFVTSVASPALTPILNNSDKLPGSPATTPQTFFQSPVVDGDNVYFVGSDEMAPSSACGGAFWGVFVTGLAGGSAGNVANTCDALPGIPPIDSANAFWPGMAANEGTAVFYVGTTDGTYIYSSVNGALAPVVGYGDVLPDGTVDGVVAPGSGAINGGRVVFEVGVDGNEISSLYVASLGCATSETKDVSITLGPLQHDQQTATVTNTGKSALAGPLSLVVAGLPKGVTLANRNGTTVCVAPDGSPYINLNLAHNTLPVGASAKVTLEFADPSGTGITFSSELVGPGAR